MSHPAHKAIQWRFCGERRDASGNVLSVYTKDAAINNGNLTQSEVDTRSSINFTSPRLLPRVSMKICGAFWRKTLFLMLRTKAHKNHIGLQKCYPESDSNILNILSKMDTRLPN